MTNFREVSELESHEIQLSSTTREQVELGSVCWMQLWQARENKNFPGRQREINFTYSPPPAEELTPLLEGSVTTGYKRCIVCDSAELCDALDSHGFAALTAQLNFNTLLSSVNSMYDFHYFTAQTLWSQNWRWIWEDSVEEEWPTQTQCNELTKFDGRGLCLQCVFKCVYKLVG